MNWKSVSVTSNLVLRVPLGVAMVMIGISAYRDFAPFVANVTDGLGWASSVGHVWAFFTSCASDLWRRLTSHWALFICCRAHRWHRAWLRSGRLDPQDYHHRSSASGHDECVIPDDCLDGCSVFGSQSFSGYYTARGRRRVDRDHNEKESRHSALFF